MAKHLLTHPRWWVLLTLGLAIGYSAVATTLLHTLTLVPITAGWLLLAYRMHWASATAPLPARGLPWSLLPLTFWGIYVYLAASFGIVDLGAVFFHLQAGISHHGGGKRIVDALLYSVSVLAVLVAFTWLIRHDARWQRLERWLALLLLVSNPLLYGISQRSAAIVTEDGAWLERRYVPPVIHQAPETPPNLLLIYLEGLERTYADPQRFGDSYAPLDALGQGGMVFEGVRQIDNTGWTMAGMIASQCGTPLMPAGLLHDSQFQPLDQVVPGVDCLGDLLSEQGYQLTYMGGASSDFAGKGKFYRGHGFDKVEGRESLAPRLDNPEYLNSWGLYDDSLYDFSVKEIRRLNDGDKPWALVNLSVGTHPPYGFPAHSCTERQGEHDGVDILYSVECGAWLARSLIERLYAEGLLDNTLVVIASDHLSMKASAWDQLMLSPRANTFMMLGKNIPPRRFQVEASTMDLLPTILEGMGFDIERHRAGLGVSLLSGQPTLVERYGVEVLNTRMREETALHERLWEGLAIPNAKEGAGNTGSTAN
ncbi:MAG: sulfatase-like hydrolase/transferase [Halomonas sp.]|uniref:sulfatase-like hydrolase/transferase n=1 Tax=Halomonas sp. TaxID=1486246 RepID=UPI003F90876D